MERLNEACTYISDFAWRNKVFGTIELQKNLYYDVRNQYDVSAQIVVRAEMY